MTPACRQAGVKEAYNLERGKKAGFKITGAVDRFEYGLKYNRVIETGGLAVSQEIQITCNVELNEDKG